MTFKLKVPLIFLVLIALSGCLMTGNTHSLPGEAQEAVDPVDLGFCPGDANGDLLVSGADFLLWQTGDDSADFNDDGSVDAADMNIWVTYNGTNCNTPEN